MGSYQPAAFGDLYDLGGLEGNFLSNTVKAVKKAAVDTGHVTGKVVTSKIGQAALGVTLAATGVGAAPAALIFAGTKATGTALKPGGNIKNVLTAGAQGAVEGATASVAGKGVRAAFSKLTAPKAPARDVPAPLINKVAQVQQIEKVQNAAMVQGNTPIAEAAQNKKTAVAVDVAQTAIRTGTQKGFTIAGAAANTVDRSGSDYAKQSRQAQKDAKAAADAGDTSGAAKLLADAKKYAQLATQAGTTARNIRGAIQTATGQVQGVIDAANRGGEAVVAATDAGVAAATSNSSDFGSMFSDVVHSKFFIPGLIGLGALFVLKSSPAPARR